MYYYPFILLAVMLIFVIAFDALAKLHSRKTGKQSSYFIELMRKGAHTTAGILFAFAPYFGITTISQYLILVAGLFIVIINESKFFYFKMRPGALKFSWLFTVAAIPLYYYQYFVIYTMAMLIYTIPDTLAALLGRAFGKPIKVIANKSIVGFLAYVISASVILSFAPIHIMFAIGIAIILAIIEIFAKGGSDNFFCPTVAIILLYLLGVR